MPNTRHWTPEQLCRLRALYPDLKADTVAQVATVLVDTAKVEIDYIKATGSDRSDFLEPPMTTALPPPSDTPTANNPFPTVVRHRLAG